jgi:hypothetical protein
LHEIYDAATTPEQKIEFEGFTAYATFPFLSAIIISLELINWTNCGFKVAFDSLFRTKDGKRKTHWPVVIVASLKLCIIILCMTLSSKISNEKLDEPELKAMVGLAIVFALLVTRVLGRFFIRKAAMAEDKSKNSTQRATNVKIDTDQTVGGGPSVEEEEKEEEEKEEEEKEEEE